MVPKSGPLGFVEQVQWQQFKGMFYLLFSTALEVGNFDIELLSYSDLPKNHLTFSEAWLADNELIAVFNLTYRVGLHRLLCCMIDKMMRALKILYCFIVLICCVLIQAQKDVVIQAKKDCGPMTRSSNSRHQFVE